MTTIQESNSKEIKPISKSDVHRICSGQVVLNLATAVKELVENSLDAGATVIEIVLKDYGSELVQVSDNGSGVLPQNFQALTLKHHTSKLQDFSDLLSVETFGFRGEALSSLCALSDVSVITRHSSLPCATKLTFDSNGIISSTTQIARQVGTTLMLSNIFSTLPVRQKEFHRNLKREFSKMCQLLTAYCLVSTGVKITCLNETTKKGGRSTVVATQGCKTVRENIACVYTTKQLSNLIEINEADLKDETLDELKITRDESKLFRLEGFISSCSHGCGRATGDRQFYYINSRPCEPTKIMRIVNEVYHQYNAHQNPFVFLDIQVARNSVDVNVTPDKRQIFLDNEKLLMAVVKQSLLKLYENIPSRFQINNISVDTVKKLAENYLSKSNGIKSENASTISDASGENADVLKNEDSFEESQSSIIDVSVTDANSLSDSKIDFNGSSCSQELSDDLKSVSFNNSENTDLLTSWTHNSASKLKRSCEDAGSARKNTKQMKLDSNLGLSPLATSPKKKRSINQKMFEMFKQKLSSSKNEVKENDDVEIHPIGINEVVKHERIEDANDAAHPRENNPMVLVREKDNDTSGIVGEISCENITEHVRDNQHEVEIKEDCKDDCIDDDYSGSSGGTSHKRLSINRNLSDIGTSFNRWLDDRKKDDEAASRAAVRFRAIIDPNKNEQAEQELSREIKKEMFCDMEVIGQFNLGFIIAKLKSDLFIVDQHATDEKYNFETLQKTTSLTNQKLVIPQKLELTAINETILIENIEIFRANGFEFHINEDAPPTERVSLTAIPMSKGWTFGKEDIDELLFMLQDSPHTLCRPSRVRAMFASRACRKSVMIGTALSQSKMKSLLTHMGEIEQPWNCPHGRPTMRHLVNLDFYK